MNIAFQPVERRVRLAVDGLDLGERTLDECRALRDAIDDQLVAHMQGFDWICDRAAQFYGLKAAAMFSVTRGPASVSQARLLAMSLFREINPHLADGQVARFFKRDRTMVGYAAAWLAEREAQPQFKDAVATLRAGLARHLEEQQERGT